MGNILNKIFKRSEKVAGTTPSKVHQAPLVHAKQKSLNDIVPDDSIMNGNIRGFQAAESNNHNTTWFAPSTSINSQLVQQLGVLRSRSRERIQNDDYAKGYVKMYVSNVIGATGIRLQALASDSNGKRDELATAAIENAWKAWAKYPKNVDVSGRDNWKQILEQAVRIYCSDGEVFIRHIEGSAAGQFGYSVQVIDSSLCDHTYNVPKLENGNSIIMGVEVNQWLKPVAYYFLSDDERVATKNKNGKMHIRIDAGDIVHAFSSEFPNQVRGIPPLHASLNRLRMLSKFEEAALINAAVGAANMGFYTRKESSDPIQDTNIAQYGNNGELIDEVQAGQLKVLPVGYDFTQFNSKYPEGELPEFKKSMLRAVSSSLGIDYPSLGQDLESVNLSSARVAINETREQYKSVQQMFVDKIVTPVYERWLTQALLRKKILVKGSPLPLASFDKYANVTWLPRRWQWSDPVRDVQSNVSLINNRIKSLSSVASEIGIDFESEIELIVRDEEYLKKFGLVRLDKGSNPTEPADSTINDNEEDMVDAIEEDDVV